MESFDKYIGQVFDRRYKIVRIIGVGGMAVVFEAMDLRLNRMVAIKLLKEDISHDAASVKRFINESKAVSMLSHPNIVKIYDVSVKDDLKYIVMERVEGLTLKSYMQKKGVLPMAEVLSYSDQILRALEHAHSKGIIHRDIKPQNIMLLKNGAIKVTDFGIAKLPNAETVTITDKAIGTVYYISPEQASGKPIDPRSDLYSLGVMMYEMACGKLPFTADTPVSVALMQLNEQPKNPHEIVQSIPVGLEQIILTAMQKDPSKRFQSATQARKYISQLRANPKAVFRSREGIGGVIWIGKGKGKQPQSRSMLPIICGVMTAFLIVMSITAAVVLQKLLTSNPENEPYTVEVPELTQSIYSEELIRQFNESIYKINVEYKFDASLPENTIISQEPKAGERRKVINDKQYCEITLEVSKGAEELTVPDVTVTDHRTAAAKLREYGLTVVEEEVESATFDSGLVISTEPAAGETLKVGSEIKLYVSRGQELTMVQVPDFRGYTEKKAYETMQGDDPNDPDLTLGTVTYKESTAYKKGEIVSQSRTAFTSVVKGTKIDFVVSLGSPDE